MSRRTRLVLPRPCRRSTPSCRSSPAATSPPKSDTAALGPGIDGLKHNVNAIVDNLGMFSAELARLTDEVGTQSLFGGQMRVDGVDGSWKEMTQNGE